LLFSFGLLFCDARKPAKGFHSCSKCFVNNFCSKQLFISKKKRKRKKRIQKPIDKKTERVNKKEIQNLKSKSTNFSTKKSYKIDINEETKLIESEVIISAKITFQEVLNKFHIPNGKQNDYFLACITLAADKLGYPYTVRKIVDAFSKDPLRQERSHILKNTFRALKNLRKMLKIRHYSHPLDFVNGTFKFLHMKLDERHQAQQYIEQIFQVYKSSFVNPKAVCLAVVFVVLNDFINYRITYSKLSNFSGITEITIRKFVKEIKTCLKHNDL